MYQISLNKDELDTLTLILLDVKCRINKDHKNATEYVSKNALGYLIYQIDEISKQLDDPDENSL